MVLSGRRRTPCLDRSIYPRFCNWKSYTNFTQNNSLKCFIKNNVEASDSVGYAWLSMGHRWHDANRRKSTYSREKSVPPPLNHKFHMEWPGAERGLPRWKTDSTIVNDEFQGVWKETGMAYLRYHTRLWIEGLRKITKNIRHCNRYSKYGLTESEGKYLTNCVGRRILFGLGIIYTHVIYRRLTLYVYKWDGRPRRPLNTNTQWRLRGNPSILLMVWLIWKVRRHTFLHVYNLLGLFAEFHKATMSFVMSVCLSIIMKNWAPTGQIFMNWNTWLFLENLLKKFTFD